MSSTLPPPLPTPDTMLTSFWAIIVATQVGMAGRALSDSLLGSKRMDLQVPDPFRPVSLRRGLARAIARRPRARTQKRDRDFSYSNATPLITRSNSISAP
jgi:hypothetical protein